MKYSERFLETIKGKAAGKEVTPDSVLKDLGIDSLDLVELVLDAETEYGVTFSNDELTSFKTVRDVMNALDSKQ